MLKDIFRSGKGVLKLSDQTLTSYITRVFFTNIKNQLYNKNDTDEMIFLLIIIMNSVISSSDGMYSISFQARGNEKF